MKINYNIICVDDKPGQMDTILKEISELIDSYQFIPNFEKTYTSYEDFKATFDNIKGYDGIFYDCDLLLIDYNIAGTQKNVELTGEKLLDEIRSKGIYTEAIFYSDAMTEYRKKKDKLELDNVVYADKNELVDKVEKLIQRSVASSMIISNLRGFLMDSTSDFDFICKEVAIFYFLKLSEKDQNEILKIIEAFIHQQYELENSKFKKINNKYKDVVDFKRIKVSYNFEQIKSADDKIKKLTDALNSQESVISMSNKYIVLAKILELNSIDDVDKIYLFDEKTEESKRHIYNINIIQSRNKLAHCKLDYGACQKKIKILKTQADKCTSDCDDKNEECNAYTYEECIKLRENIHTYYKLFEKLLKKCK